MPSQLTSLILPLQLDRQSQHQQQKIAAHSLSSSSMLYMVTTPSHQSTSGSCLEVQRSAAASRTALSLICSTSVHPLLRLSWARAWQKCMNYPQPPAMTGCSKRLQRLPPPTFQVQSLKASARGLHLIWILQGWHQTQLWVSFHQQCLQVCNRRPLLGCSCRRRHQTLLGMSPHQPCCLDQAMPSLTCSSQGQQQLPTTAAKMQIWLCSQQRRAPTVRVMLLLNCLASGCQARTTASALNLPQLSGMTWPLRRPLAAILRIRQERSHAIVVYLCPAVHSSMRLVTMRVFLCLAMGNSVQRVGFNVSSCAQALAQPCHAGQSWMASDGGMPSSHQQHQMSLQMWAQTTASRCQPGNQLLAWPPAFGMGPACPLDVLCCMTVALAGMQRPGTSSFLPSSATSMLMTRLQSAQQAYDLPLMLTHLAAVCGTHRPPST